MTLRDLIQLADRSEDARAIRRVLEHCRFKYGMNYAETRDLFARSGVEAQRYEELCQMADHIGA